MANSYLLGVDIGTYSSKGVLVEAESGTVRGAHVVEHELAMPEPGWVEHDPEGTWWGEFVEICRALLEKTGIAAEAIAGVGVSGIGPCVAAVDEAGRALRAGILYGIDTRAEEEIREIEAALGRGKIHQLGATGMSSSAGGAKIRWIKKHEPEVYRQARWFLTSQSFILLRLIGKAVMDMYSACTYTPLMDVEGRRWLEGMGVLIAPRERLAEMRWSSEVVGGITQEAARLTGLRAGTPVVAGTMDSAAEAISAGVAEVGDMMMMFGSSNSFILKMDHLVRTEHFWGLNWLEPGSYAFVGGMATAGSLTRWFRDNLAVEELAAQQAGGMNAYEAMAKLLEQSEPGANGLVALPYFEGERTPMYDPHAKGAFFGLTLKHTRADLYRALLESVGYGIRHNVEVMREAGLQPKRILAVGGGSKNPGWMQIISDLAGLEMEIPQEQIGSCYGDAFLAGVGVGVFGNLGEVRRWVREGRRILPGAGAYEKATGQYRIFRELYERTKGLGL